LPDPKLLDPELPDPKLSSVSLRIFLLPGPMKMPGTSPRLVDAKQVNPYRRHAEQQAENLEVRTKDVCKTYPMG